MKTSYKLLSLLLLSVIMLSSFAFAANVLSIQAPQTNVTKGGATVLINATFDTQSKNVSNMSYYYRASNDTVWTLIRAVYQSAGGANDSITWNTTWDTTGLIDSRTYFINLTASNSTGITNSVVNASIRTDNGVPTSSLASDVPYEFQSFNDGVSWVVGLSADNTRGIINCTATSNGNTIQLNGSSNSCTRTITNSDFSISTQNEYTFYLTAYDDNGNQTNSSSRQYSINFLTGGGLGSGGGSGSVAVVTPVVNQPASSPVSDGTSDGTGESIRTKISSFFSSIKNFFSNLFNRN